MRSRKVIFAAHCLLNQNARAAGREAAAGAIKEFVELCGAAGVGIVQLPCPQLEFNGGLNREPKTRQQHDTPDYRSYCRWLCKSIAGQIERWRSHGYDVLGIIGVENSPHCAVWRSDKPGKGIMVEELAAELQSRRLAVPLIGANLNNIYTTLAELQRVLVAPQC